MQEKPLDMRSPFYRKELYDKFSLSALSEETDTYHPRQWLLAFRETPLRI